MLLNKFLIPAILVAVVMVAGVFAFMPVEKASTVHGTLATGSALTTQTTLISTQADNQQRAISFSFNMSHNPNPDGGTTEWPGNATIVLGQTGVTLTGYGSLSALPNNATTVHNGTNTAQTAAEADNRLNIQCGFITTGQDGNEGDDSDLRGQLGGNATGGMTNFTRFAGTSNQLTVGEGIAVQIRNETTTGQNGMGGICQGIVVLTNWAS